MPEKRFAVIGCGWITGALHGPAYQEYVRAHPEWVAAACCDVDPARAEDIRQRFNFERAWDNVEDLLSQEQLDAVCLNVPPELTSRLGCMVLRRGIALLCEKPPGLTTKELEHLIRAARESGSAHMVAFNRRWMPLVQAVKHSLGDRQVEHIQYTMARVGRLDPDFSTTAVHAIDAVRTLAGCDFREVVIQYRRLADAGEGVVDFSIQAQMMNGALVEIAVTPVTGFAVERALVSARGWTADLHCPTGADGKGRLEIYNEGRLDEYIDGPQAAGGDAEWLLGGFYQEDAAFFDALSSGQTPPDGLETARQAVAIMQMLRERRSRVVFA